MVSEQGPGLTREGYEALILAAELTGATATATLDDAIKWYSQLLFAVAAGEKVFIGRRRLGSDELTIDWRKHEKAH